MTDLQSIQPDNSIDGFEFRVGKLTVRITTDSLTVAMGASSITMTQDNLVIVSPRIDLNPNDQQQPAQ